MLRVAIIYYSDDPYERVFRTVHETEEGEFEKTAVLREQCVIGLPADRQPFATARILAVGETVPTFTGTPSTKPDDPWPPPRVFYVAPPELVDLILTLANVGKGDVLFDLGSGSGPILIEAAKRGAIAVGVEFDQESNDRAMKFAADAGVQISIVSGDFESADLSSATVVTVNVGVIPKLFGRLKAGTRVVMVTNDDPGLGECVASSEYNGIRVGVWVI